MSLDNIHSCAETLLILCDFRQFFLLLYFCFLIYKSRHHDKGVASASLRAILPCCIWIFRWYEDLFPCWFDVKREYNFIVTTKEKFVWFEYSLHGELHNSAVQYAGDILLTLKVFDFFALLHLSIYAFFNRYVHVVSYFSLFEIWHLETVPTCPKAYALSHKLRAAC